MTDEPNPQIPPVPAVPDDDTPIYSKRQFEAQFAKSMQKQRKTLQGKAAKSDEYLARATAAESRVAELEKQLAEAKQPEPEPEPAPAPANPYQPALAPDEQTPDETDEYLKALDEISNSPEGTSIPFLKPTSAPGEQNSVDQLRQQCADYERRLEQEQSERRTLERDLAIERALSKVGCVDIPTATRIYQQDLSYDVTTGKWTANGENVDEFIATRLPDYLRPAGAPRGGAGTSSSTPRRQDQIAAQEKRVAELRLKASQKNRTDLRVAYQREKAKLLELKGVRP